MLSSLAGASRAVQGRPSGGMSTIELTIVEEPAADPLWERCLTTFPGASVFFSANWARVLQDSYAYRPVYLVLRRGVEVVGCLPLMEMASRLRGRRAAGLPFTDECLPLASSPELFRQLIQEAMTLGRQRN